MMLLCNIDAGTTIPSPAFTIGSNGIGTTANPFWAVTARTMTQNFIQGTCGESTWGSLMQSGWWGTTILQWTPQSKVDYYCIYKGSTNGTFGTYLGLYDIVSGTTGTWIDPHPFDISYRAGTNGPLGSFDMAWSKSLYLPQPDTYEPNFVNNLITHELFNFNTIIVDKKKKYTANLTWSNIGTIDRSDLMQAFNWHANMRFYPNLPASPGIYFNVYWANDFNFKFVTPNMNGGYAGNVTLKGIEGLKNISEVV